MFETSTTTTVTTTTAAATVFSTIPITTAQGGPGLQESSTIDLPGARVEGWMHCAPKTSADTQGHSTSVQRNAGGRRASALPTESVEDRLFRLATTVTAKQGEVTT